MELPIWAQIALGISGTGVALLVGAWLRVLFKRVTKAFDDQVSAISNRVDSIETRVEKCQNRQSSSNSSFTTEIKDLVGTEVKKLFKVLSNLEDRLADKIMSVENSVGKLTDTCHKSEKDIVRLQELNKHIAQLKQSLVTIDSLRAEFLEKFINRADFTRELQSVISQVEAIYNKIDKIDNKIDNKIDEYRRTR